MVNDSSLDFSDVTMEISSAALISALLPKLVTALASNPTLLAQLTAAVTNKMLTNARSTGNVLAGYAGGNQTGKSTGVNTNSRSR